MKINTSNDEAQPIVEHDIPSTINNPTYTDSTENNNDMNYPKTRSFYEPEYFLAEMAKSGKLKSPIFHTPPQLTIPDISRTNTRTTQTIPTKAAWLKSILCSYTHKNVMYVIKAYNGNAVVGGITIL